MFDNSIQHCFSLVVPSILADEIETFRSEVMDPVVGGSPYPAQKPKSTKVVAMRASCEQSRPQPARRLAERWEDQATCPVPVQLKHLVVFWVGSDVRYQEARPSTDSFRLNRTF